MTVVFLLLILLLVGFVVVRLKKRDHQATRKRRHHEPHIGRRSLLNHAVSQKKIREDDTLEELDSDDALGLNKSPETKTPDYIKIHVMAPKGYPYNGYELLQALLANGLRFGDMNIFHRHETKSGRGPVLFSLASVNEPGTFELSKMGSFSCPGLILFMVLKSVPDMMNAFDAMLETAKQLTEDLGGEIWDEERHVLNMDKVAQIRSQIKKFEESQRIPDFFAETQSE